MDVVSETIPISIRLTRVRMQSIGPSGVPQLLGQDIPTRKVMLKKLHLRLVARTGVRDSGVDRNAHSAALEEKIDIFKESTKNVARHENIDVPTSGGWLDLGKELGINFQTLKKKYQERLVSSFATYNIWRSYALEFKVELSCVEEDMEFECEDEQAL